jgi:branched-chain amino acid transport system permease protein
VSDQLSLPAFARPQSRPVGTYAGLALLAVLLPVPLLTNEYSQYVVNLVVVYALAAVGFNIVLGYLGQLAFANVAFFGIGAYALGVLMERYGLPFLVALVPSALLGGLAGAIVGLPALRLKSYYLAIVTLVFGELMRWTYIHADALTHGSSGLGLPDVYVLGFPISNETHKYYLFLAVTGLAIWMTSGLLQSRIGRAWIAIRENEPAAASLGFSPALFKIAAFAWSGLLSALAGALFAVLIGRIAPESFNLHQLLLQFSIVMIGGLGSLTGSLLGAALLTAAPEILRNFPGLEEIVFSLLLIGVLLFIPRGLYGLLADTVPALRERRFRD